MRGKHPLLALIVIFTFVSIMPLASAVDDITVHQEYPIILGGVTCLPVFQDNEMGFVFSQASDVTSEKWKLSRVGIAISINFLEGTGGLEDVFVGLWTTTLNVEGTHVPSVKISETVLDSEKLQTELFDVDRDINALTMVDIEPITMYPSDNKKFAITVSSPETSTQPGTTSQWILCGNKIGTENILPSLENFGGDGWSKSSGPREDFRFFFQLFGVETETTSDTITEGVTSPNFLIFLVLLIAIIAILIAIVVSTRK